MIWSDFWELSVEPQIQTLEVRTSEGYRRLWNRELAPMIGAEDVSAMTWKRANEVMNEASRRIAISGEPFASLILDKGEGKTGPLVANEGRYTSPVTITHNWRSWCLAHGVVYVPPKNLRSSYATIMAEAGAEDSAVSLNMGHSDGTTKGTHYQSATVATKCRAADRLTDWLGQLAPNIPPRKAPAGRPKTGERPGQSGVPQFNHGASDRNRTRNPLITKVYSELPGWLKLS